MAEVDKSLENLKTVDPRRGLLSRIAASASFAKAARLQELLIYLAECALQKPQAPLTEQQVGVAVFNRPPGYDTSADTIVRVQVSEVRKRLKYYFASEGAAESIIMELPRGSYLPNFYRRDVQEGIRTEATATQEQTKPSLPEPATPQEMQPPPLQETRSSSPARSASVLWLSSLLGLAIILCAWLAYQNAQLRTSSAGAPIHNPIHNPISSAAIGKCVSTSAGKGWTNTPFPVQTGIFTATFDAAPAASTPINDVIGFSDGAQHTINRFAVIVAFSETGYILARNGGSYTAANAIRYSAGSVYHFRLVIDAPAHTYAVYVTPPGGSEITIGSNFTFRSEANGVKSLNSIGSAVDTASGGITYCNFTIS